MNRPIVWIVIAAGLAAALFAVRDPLKAVVVGTISLAKGRITRRVVSVVNSPGMVQAA